MKSRFLQLTSALLVFCMLAALPACTTEVPPGGEQQTEPQPTPPVTIPIDLLSQYALIRPAEADADIISAASELYAELTKRNANVGFKDDFYREGVPEFAIGEYEILIGQTNRPESIEFLSSLRIRDYGYALIGQKLVIAGATTKGTRLALEAFRKNVLDAVAGETFYSTEADFRFTADYLLDELLIGQTPIQAFRIVYPAGDTLGESVAASALRERLADAVGFALPIHDDSTPLDGTPEIRIGKTNRGSESAEAALAFDGTHLYLGGKSHAELSGAAETFLAQLSAAEGRSLTFAPTEPLTAVTPDTLTAMSYNIYCVDMRGKRINGVLNMIERFLPDTFGVQEATSSWMEILQKNLGHTYTFVGEGRDGGSKGEHSAIAFKTDRFELLEQDTFWLSDTPDQVSKYSTSAHKRIATYARLKCLADGREILVVNTHLDHESGEAREKQAQVLVNFLQKYPDLPIILTGDFNAGPTSRTCRTILDHGLDIAAVLSPFGDNIGTHDSGSIIDFVFTTPASVRVLGYKVANDQIGGEYPSDHFPVIAEYVLK